MKNIIIDKKRIKDLLIEASSEWDVYAPQRNLGQDAWIDPVLENTTLESVALENADTVIPPKDIFFPQLELLFEFKEGKIKETVEASPKLLFGIKSCDLKGILFSDEFYGVGKYRTAENLLKLSAEGRFSCKRNFEDKYYLSRIENRFIVVIGCIKPPRPTCFCTSAESGPFAKKGYDLQLIENKDSFLVETGSKKGEEFIKKHKKYFESSANEIDLLIAGIKLKASAAVELKVDFKKALELMAQDTFIPEENYKRIGERCIYCGGCLYVCPTCTCFNVFDDGSDKEGRRFRNWDACVFEGYTRETSGHNPRKEKWQRTSRRYEHKLKYDYKVTGTSGCVGCGRCLSSCPVDIGISKFIQEITDNKKIM